jgi:heme oxygenase
MSLKELTQERHALAENTAFMRSVFAGTLPLTTWADYTYQKFQWYQAIEHQAGKMGLLDQLPGIARAHLIRDDFNHMTSGNHDKYSYKMVTGEYVQYINSLDDAKRVLAHLYTWHMGDMFGGQMIKKLIDAPHRHLEFDNARELMMTMRGMLTDDLSDEANVAFDWAIRILSEYDC